MSRSVFVRLRSDLSRDDARNEGTGLFLPPRSVPRPEFREVFIRHYDSIHSCHEPLAAAGVVVTAIGPLGFEGSAVISATPDCINVITIGRHSHADLFLSGDPTMSLRQGVVIVYPHAEGEGVRFRVLDLRAAHPFEDERGRQFEALEAEGPVFLRTGAYTLFVLPKESGSPFCPERPWEEMPERIYLEEAVLEPDAARSGHRLLNRFPKRAAIDSEPTMILPLAGPVFDHEKLLEDGEDPRGQLVVRSAEGEMILVLGSTAAARGVLLGRYPRCDGGGLGILSDPAISRVHALIIEIAGRLYAIDAGSTNGLWIGGDRVQVASLVPGVTVALAGRAAALEWSVN